MNIESWAERWHVHPNALTELRAMAGALTVMKRDLDTVERSESSVQARVKSDAAKRGGLLFRNNVGAFKPQHGGFVRYGLANETAEMNRETKSSDLIGITPVVITPEMVGSTVGVFTARETKKTGWRYTGNDRERAQLNFINIILSLGGDARFTTGSELG